MREQIQASAAPGLPLHFTEWSTSYNPRDSVHDSYHGASYVLTKVKDGSYFTKVQPAAELPPLAIALSNMKPRCIRGSHPSHRLQTK